MFSLKEHKSTFVSNPICKRNHKIGLYQFLHVYMILHVFMLAKRKWLVLGEKQSSYLIFNDELNRAID